MSSMYCWSLFGGRYIAAIMIGLLLLMCILVAVISSCVGVVIGSWIMSDLMASSTHPPYPSFLSFRRRTASSPLFLSLSVSFISLLYSIPFS